MKVIYIAGPFRAENSWDMECNIRRAETLALEVWRMGAAALCPHTNTRFFQGAAPDACWLEGCLELLDRCDAILMTPDWTKSSGAIKEWQFAVKRKMPIFYNLPDLKVWLGGAKAKREVTESALNDFNWAVGTYNMKEQTRRHGPVLARTILDALKSQRDDLANQLQRMRKE